MYVPPPTLTPLARFTKSTKKPVSLKTDFLVPLMCKFIHTSFVYQSYYLYRLKTASKIDIKSYIFSHNIECVSLFGMRQHNAIITRNLLIYILWIYTFSNLSFNYSHIDDYTMLFKDEFLNQWNEFIRLLVQIFLQRRCCFIIDELIISVNKTMVYLFKSL